MCDCRNKKMKPQVKLNHRLNKFYNTKDRFTRLLKNKLEEFLFKGILRQNEDILALQYLAPLSPVYLPWSQSAMRPSAIVGVLNEITVNNRSCIVECGGGISTVYIARVLKKRGGHLYTIEHDAIWAKHITEFLEAENLQKFVTVICAPLKKCDMSLDGSYWYDKRIISKVFSEDMIDLVVIDGPPAWQQGQELSRYPALPKFKKYLKEDFCIILDDIDRLGEKKILKIWKKDFGIILEKRYINGSIAIGRSRRFFTV